MPTTLTNASALVRVALTPRDLAIFQTLADARFLTAAAIEWLHFPDRRPVWEADMQARMQTACTEPYRIGRSVYRRLHLLVSAGYLYRLVRPIARLGHGGGREPDLYALSERGADAVAMEQDDPIDRASEFRQRPWSHMTTNHAAEIGDVYAALRVKIASMPGLAMEGWQHDVQLSRAYDQVTVTRPLNGRMERVVLPVVPDGTFVLVHPRGRMRVFLEVDRGTRRTETWREKIMAYQAYHGSPALHTRYGTQQFLVLAIAPSTVQQRRLMNATAAVVGGASPRYLFTLRAAVHPLRIGAEWRRIAGITRTPVAVEGVGRMHERVEAVTEPHIFLQ
ncbi:replication-relaxation family protein [Herpetosiphon gulosus]|uniref:Replication-relaxation n=1 Tax=Herpetosiphon gulosus TaxID=1973496 RepID=A0ABP9X836_9CHLR